VVVANLGDLSKTLDHALNLKDLNKFHAIKTEYGGVRYDSKREAEYARELDLRMHAQGKDRVETWERQIRFPLIVNGLKICTYVCDFLVRYADGRRELVEVKGMQTEIFKLKLKLFRATFLNDHPEIIYTIQS